MTPRILALAAMLAPSVAFAHPGHGTTEPDSWVHYLTEPVHVISLAVVGIAVTITTVSWRRARRSRTRDRLS